ncbi:MAG: capsular polysaccharide biosynthesis protein CapK [Armatimonadota bacterium]|nr:MAG: capsular polysaccharide biosynthesis protein CapK [Armatimonadota bacterium]
MSTLKKLSAALKNLSAGDWLLRRNPLFYPAALRLLHRLESAPLEERKRFTQERLKKVLRAASRTRYGRQTGAGENILDWPLLEKSQVRDDPRAFVRGAVWLSSPASTSGTTGLPLKLYRSFQSVAVEQASIDRLVLAKGIDPRTARTAVLRGENIKDPSDREPPFWKFVAGGRRMVMSSNHLSPQTIEAYHAALSAFAPECLMAYPTSLESLCRLLQATGKSLCIPLVVTSSEVLTPQTRKLAQEVLGAELVDYYGQAERVAFAYSFQEGDYRFLAGYAFVELLPAGEEKDAALYEIAGTNLWNLKMPLVRYRSGDLIRLPKGLSEHQIEAIRYGVEPFGGVLGRQGDYLVSPDGAHLMGIDHIPRDVEHVVRMQVVQESPHRVRLLVVPTRDFNERDRQQILHNASLKLPAEMRVDIEVVQELERTAQNKTPFVIRQFEAEGGIHHDHAETGQ